MRKSRPPAMPVPLEADEQKWLLEWVRLNAAAHPALRLFYHIPNEGKRTNHAGRELKEQGMRRGVPDNCLPVPRGKYGALYIELKRRQGNKPTDEQLEWIADLNAAGNLAVVCYGWEEAAIVIQNYLRKGEPHIDRHR